MSEEAPLEQLRVLVVDGDHRSRGNLRAALERRGWWVRESGGVVEACRSLEAAHADVVLVDDELPDGSALDLARALADVEPRPRVGLISAKLWSVTAYRQLSGELGISFFLRKPPLADEVASQIAGLFPGRCRNDDDSESGMPSE